MIGALDLLRRRRSGPSTAASAPASTPIMTRGDAVAASGGVHATAAAQPAAAAAARAPSRWCIVTGTMRSGTTLLGEMLNAQSGARRHPDLAFDNDRSTTVLLRRVAAQVRARSGIAGWQVEDIDRPLTAEPGAIGAALGLAAAPDTAEAAALRLEAALAAEIVRNCGLAWPAPVLGFKATHLFRELDLLAAACVRTVVMVRDPRDVVASNIRRLGRDYPVAVPMTILAALAGYGSFLAANDVTNDVTNDAGDGDAGGSAIRAVRYEDLVADPEATLRGVLGFFGLDPERYDWAALDAGVLASNSSWNSGCGGDLVAGAGIAASGGRWRAYLSPVQQCAVEIAAHDLMQRFGYTPERLGDRALERMAREHVLPDALGEADRRGVSHKALDAVLARDRH